MYGTRRERLAQQLQEEIASILMRELKDPNLGFVTITKVELTGDLGHAKVLYSFLGSDKDRERSREVLDRSAGFVRSLIKKRLRLKLIPEIAFRYDESIAQSIDIAAKLDELKNQHH